MTETANISDGKKPHTNGVTKLYKTGSLEWPKHITELKLNNCKIRWLEENIKFPPNLLDLNISHNELTEVPNAVLNLKKLRSLDISYNAITNFDNNPKFCHAIEMLNLSHNNLQGPPYWVWARAPLKLTNIDLGFNYNLTKSLTCSYFEELLQYTTELIDIKINNCSLTNHLNLLHTLPKAKVLELGSSSLSLFSVNRIHEMPCAELKKCCDIERLNLSNVQLYTIKNNIDTLSKLVEINLSHNEIGYVPDEFCNLKNLEICDLSYNHLLYLPDNIGKLGKLISLRLNSNELCMLPDSISELETLQILDLYDNSLYDIPDGLKNISEIDLALNYFDEPEESNYLEKRGRLRLTLHERFNGKKLEHEQPESERSYEETDDEELLLSSHSNQEPHLTCDEPPSSPEDWDSDDYWVPRYHKQRTPPPQSPWLYFVKRKMEEGNFCPMDIHTVSIADRVKYEKLCNPPVAYESEGQFDDYSDDNS